MKLKSGEKVHYDSGPNMTPLVDIVMVILIFLMLTGSFAAGEHFLQSNLPLTSKGAGLTEKPKDVPKDEQLEIRVDSFNVTGASGQTEPVWVAVYQGKQFRNDRIALEQALKTTRANYAKSNISDEKVQVVIIPGANTKYKHLVHVYQAALLAEFKKVAFGKHHN